jgi:hypothetical protein
VPTGIKSLGFNRILYISGGVGEMVGSTRDLGARSELGVSQKNMVRPIREAATRPSRG